MTSMEEMYGKPISVYTRAQAIEDGVLIDITEEGNARGFRVPVAMTVGLYSELSEALANRGEDKAKLLRETILDLCHMMVTYIKLKMADFDGPYMYFKYTAYRTTLDLKLVSGPGDNGEHVMTVMLWGED